jgi:hypothetical protein
MHPVIRLPYTVYGYRTVPESSQGQYGTATVRYDTVKLPYADGRIRPYIWHGAKIRFLADFAAKFGEIMND